MGKTKTRPSAASRSASIVMAGLSYNRKVFNDMWSLAYEAPLFLKQPSARALQKTAAASNTKGKSGSAGVKKAGKGRKELSSSQSASILKTATLPQRRSFRFLSNNCIKTLASGAAGVVAQRMSNDAQSLRTDPGDELPRGPFLPGFSPGFVRFLEQLLCSYVHEIVHDAVCFKEAINENKIRHTKLTSKTIKIGIKTANERVFALRHPGSSLWDSSAMKDAAVPYKTVKKKGRSVLSKQPKKKAAQEGEGADGTEAN